MPCFVQNPPKRVVTGVTQYEHIMPVLRHLHWLLVRKRVDFKLAVLVFKALHDSAPPYLAEDCQLVATTDHCD